MNATRLIDHVMLVLGISAITLLLAASNPMALGQEVEAQRQESDGQEREAAQDDLTEDQQSLCETFKELMDAKITALEHTSQLDPQQLEALKQAAQPRVDSYKEHVKNVQEGLTDENLQKLQSRVNKEFVKAIQALVDQKVLTQQQLESYQEDQRLKQEFLIQAITVTTLAKLEQRFVLHGRQPEQLSTIISEALAQELLQLDLENAVTSVLYSDSIFELVPEEKLMPLLTERQREHYSNWSEVGGEGAEDVYDLVSSISDNDEDTSNKARKTLETLYLEHLDLVHQRLQVELELSDTQMRKLKIAGKGVVSRLIKKQVEAYERMDSDEEFDLVSTDMMTLYTDFPQQLVKADLHRKSLEKVLSDAQRAKLAEVRKTRSDRLIDANAMYLVASLGEMTDEGLFLTGGQLEKSIELFKSSVETKEVVGFPDMMLIYRQVAAVNKEKLLTIFDQQQATYLDSLFAEIREELVEMTGEQDQAPNR